MPATNSCVQPTAQHVVTPWPSEGQLIVEDRRGLEGFQWLLGRLGWDLWGVDSSRVFLESLCALRHVYDPWGPLYNQCDSPDYPREEPPSSWRKILWNHYDYYSAVFSGRAADGHDDMYVDEPKLNSIRLFLPNTTVFLIKKMIQLITFVISPKWVWTN